MILALFLVILAISFVLIVFGELTDEGVYSLGGLLLLFILGISVLLPGGLTIPNGEVVSFNYSCGCCDDHEFIMQDSYMFFCFGTPQNCDYYDGDETNCELVGCTWDDNSSLCFGNPRPCDEYTELVPCTIAVCQYGFEPGSSCPNGTIEVISSETHTPTQEPFNDSISHIMGVWLTLIAVFGLAIKLGQIREGFKQHD